MVNDKLSIPFVRAETKNRGRESTIPPLPVSRKRHRASTNRVETLGKHGAKKSRLNMVRNCCLGKLKL